MRWHWPPLLWASLGIAGAAPDPSVVSDVARSTGIAREDILASLARCDGTTFDMQVCGNYDWKVEDRRLNDLYAKARKRARELDAESPLVKSQRAWVAYRDAACRFEGRFGAGGGTAEGLYVLSCLKDMTRIRADELARIASD